MVGEVGLEPTRFIQPTDFKSVAYTNSATRPGELQRIIQKLQRYCPTFYCREQVE